MTTNKHAEAPLEPPSNHLARWLIGLSVLLCVVFVAVYFGGGGKIWLHPKHRLSPHVAGSFLGPVFIVESEEDAQRLTDAYARYGTLDMGDIQIDFRKLRYEKQHDRHLVCGEVFWTPWPYHGYPGDIEWIATTMDEIQTAWDNFTHKYHPDVRYEWHPDLKTKFEDELKPYRYPRQDAP